MTPDEIAILAVTNHADGAWPNNATVRKVNSQPDDANPDGTLGKIMGSIDVRHLKKAATYAYFVVWPATAPVPVFVADTNNDGTPRLERVDDA